MKASYRWLRSLVPQMTASPQDLAARLTSAGLEVEAITKFGEAAEQCLIVAVVSLKPHPKKDGLRLVTVDRGGSTLEVVCGAPNVPEPGGLVVLAPLGARVKGMLIEARPVGGIVSEGMLCSESELGLTEESDGILILPPKCGNPGAPLSAALPETVDHILEIGLTPNRPDCLGHLGLAREICALYDYAFAPQAVAEKDATGAGDPLEQMGVAAVITDAAGCSSYSLGAAVGTKVMASPLWLRYRLSSLGVRSISNIVDITNLVMLEFGHPMHAFDMDRLASPKISIRKATAGEALVTLDGKTRSLAADDMVIADSTGPIALAGVMGGKRTEVGPETSRVLFECATFDPRSVRRAARRHGIHSESSHRFERGVDPGDETQALFSALKWAQRLGQATLAQGTARTQSETKFPKTIRLRAARLRSLLGIDVPWVQVTTILIQLGCTVAKDTGAALEIAPPTHRPDITREVDLIEEVIRVIGMDKLPEVLPRVQGSPDIGESEALLREVKNAATKAGLSEAILLSLTSQASLATLGCAPATVVLENALSENANVLRTAILPSLLEVAKEAQNHGADGGELFSVGPVFTSERTSEGLPVEKLELAAVLFGDCSEYLLKARSYDAFDALGRITTLLAALGYPDAAFESAPFGHLHPRGSANVTVRQRGTEGARTVVGEVGPLHPKLDTLGGAMVVRLDLDTLRTIARPAPQYAAIARFPASTRDLGIVVKDAARVGHVLTEAKALGAPLLADASIVDRYQGTGIPEGHVAYTLRLEFRTPGKTLTDAEVDAVFQKISTGVTQKFEAKLRS
jgi:phenylalanyl-tRNA synthetase beta chain